MGDVVKWFDDSDDRVAFNADTHCPVCYGLLGGNPNVCSACQAVWPTGGEFRVLREAMDALASSEPIEKRRALARMVSLGLPSLDRAEFVFRAADFLVSLDCPGGWDWSDPTEEQNPWRPLRSRL